jgi:hypothetical protein
MHSHAGDVCIRTSALTRYYDKNLARKDINCENYCHIIAALVRLVQRQVLGKLAGHFFSFAHHWTGCMSSRRFMIESFLNLEILLKVRHSNINKYGNNEFFIDTRIKRRTSILHVKKIKFTISI